MTIRLMMALVAAFGIACGPEYAPTRSESPLDAGSMMVDAGTPDRTVQSCTQWPIEVVAATYTFQDNEGHQTNSNVTKIGVDLPVSNLVSGQTVSLTDASGTVTALAYGTGVENPFPGGVNFELPPVPAPGMQGGPSPLPGTTNVYQYTFDYTITQGPCSTAGSFSFCLVKTAAGIGGDITCN